ncbi:pathogenesis-related protein 10-like isoform X3 [Gastrolobium bilobum]|uniref:pathogenesis-related protein 10-like isoform X3 n=1 Tax=Gastrolobium bilobum TaxID=150636 RepID=UPI002AB23A29|nr:pathogenesis-related protein 10-like isoform X3 [Gastrolobium bilobum]
MGVVTQEYATPAAVPPARLFKAMSLDFHNLFPKIVDIIQSIEFTEGSGGAGTIKKLTTIEGDKTKYVLHRVDAIDEVNFVYNFSIIGGTGLADNLEKVSFESKLVEGPNGGSIRKVHVQYFTKGDAKLSEEELKAGQAKVEGLVKLVEGYLLANPDY